MNKLIKEKSFQTRPNFFSKIKITDEQVFLFIYGVWFLTINLSTTYLTDLFAFNHFRAIVYGIVYAYTLWYLMTMERVKISTSFGILLFIIVGALSYHFSGLTYMLSLVCMAVCARNFDYRKFFKVYIVIALAVMAVSFYASINGFILNDIKASGDRYRYAMGYTYVSYASHMIFFVSLAYIAVRKQIKIIEAVVLLICNYIVFSFTDTKVNLYSACIIIGLSLFVIILDKTGNLEKIEQNKIIRYILIASPFLFLIFSYAVHLLYNPDVVLWVKINRFLNNRLSLGRAGILGIPLTMFGQIMIWNDWAQPLGFGSYFFVDNSFINMMLLQGWVYTFIVLLGLSIVLKRAVDSKNTGLILAILGCMVLSLGDPELSDVRFQPIILLIGWMFRTEDL